MRDLMKLPPNLPAPVDDGACAHLPGMALPEIALPSTRGGRVSLAEASAARAVVFAYPRTGRPDLPSPDGWDLIPGARGCTPQSCGFRDLHQEFRARGYRVYGLSTNPPAYQREFAERMEIPFDLLSDERLRVQGALRLPVFRFEDEWLFKRLALVAEGGRIVKVFYPVFPPDRNAADVLAWIDARK